MFPKAEGKKEEERMQSALQYHNSQRIIWKRKKMQMVTEELSTSSDLTIQRLKTNKFGLFKRERDSDPWFVWDDQRNKLMRTIKFNLNSLNLQIIGSEQLDPEDIKLVPKKKHDIDIIDMAV